MKYNSIGEQLIAKAQELDPNYKPDKFNDMSEAIDVILNNSSSSEGGDIWLDITPYISEDNTSISQEGFDLVWNAFSPDVDNPSNKYAGILFNNFKAYLNKTILGDKSAVIFNITATQDIETMELVLTIYNDKSFVISQNFGPSSPVSNKIWFDVRAIGDVYLTEEQYNTLVSYAKNDLLAGINANGFFIPLQGISDIKSDKPTLTFEGWYLSIGLITITINSEDRKVDFIVKSVLMSPTTSPSSQLIPSIKTDGSQQNLSIGDGLTVENGALKTTIPALPSDANTKTYVLKSVNGVLTWSE